MMNTKDTIQFILKVIPHQQTMEIEGISFSGIAYIDPIINGLSMFEQDIYLGTFLVFKELEKSYKNSGKYLLFTSVSGVADDAGWEYVTVSLEEDRIDWRFFRDGKETHYSFEKSRYINGVIKIEKAVMELDREITLEPENVIYPE